MDAAALPTEALTRSFNWGDGQALAPDSRTSAHQRARTRARALRQADRPRRRSNAIRPPHLRRGDGGGGQPLSRGCDAGPPMNPPTNI